ncbi:sensor histidine kinase [Hydrogenimonas thermophila]|nr:ATP-binding protein [Hydrogenimonas thermophila]
MFKIDELLKQFHISKEDIQLREKLKSKLCTFSAVLANNFCKNYLQNDEKIYHYYNINELIKIVNKFIIFIFTAPIDNRFLYHIYKIGSMFASIKLDSAILKYIFCCINQLLYKMSELDSIIKNNLDLISRFLAMVEYVIIDYTYSNTTSPNSISNNTLIIAIDNIYRTFIIHKNNFLKIEKYMKNDSSDVSLINSIENNPLMCKSHDDLISFRNQVDLLNRSGIDIDEIISIYKDWNIAISKFKSSIKSCNENKKIYYFNQLTLLNKKLNSQIERLLKYFSTSSFLSLLAGLKAIHAIHKIFSKHNLILDSEEDIKTNIIERVKKIFDDVVPWAIEEIIIDSKYLNILEYDIVKKVEYEEYIFYFGIKLVNIENRQYIEEILMLLLEAIELNFIMKKREQSLVEFAKKAESANGEKDDFLACISHELRTPLTAINGFSQILMMSQDTPDKIKKYLEKINKEGNSLLNMVNTILDFAKLDAGKVDYNQKMSKVIFIIREVKLLTIHMANRKNISLNISVDENLTLMIDPELFKQVLLNLISNAIKFTPENGKINLTASYNEQYKEYIFSICDTGVGIAKEDQTKLFHSFVQIENIYQKSVAGSGLGLMICKKIIEDLHQGRIWVESKPGNGSCFYFSIPVENID